jgi:hypothetical protein
VLSCCACRRGTDAPAAPREPRVDAGVAGASRVPSAGRDGAAEVASGSADEEDAAAAAERLNGLICKRPRCCITRVMPAGVGADGTRFTVVRVDLMPRRRRCAPPQTDEKEEDVVDPAALDAEHAGEVDEKQHERYRWDLVEEKAGKVRWRQPLEIDRWGDSFGMGGGEDGVGADPEKRTISYSHEGGSAWRGSRSVTVGLDPFRVVEFSWRSWFSAHSDEDSVNWSWDTFSGSRSTSTEFCRTGPSPDAGYPAEVLDGDTNDNEQPVAALDEVIVPKLALPAGFVKSGWSTTSFRDCAAQIDGKDLGFTIHGPARGDSGDSQMWAVVSSDGVLFIEVTDDHLVPNAKSWVKADHLELWSASASAGHGRGSGCFQVNPDASALQWAVGLDGRVIRAHGTPAADPTARVTVTPGGARFRVMLPDKGASLTVVYSDSDDGVRQKRLIATSRLQYARTWTIGSVTAIPASQATCVVTGGALRPKVAPLRKYPSLLFPEIRTDFDGD